MTALYFSCHKPCSGSHPLAKQTDVAILSSQAQGYPAVWRPASLLQAICKTITTHVWIDIQGLLKVTVIALFLPSTWLTYIHLYRSVLKDICNKILLLTLLYAGRIDYFFSGSLGSLCGRGRRCMYWGHLLFCSHGVKRKYGDEGTMWR